MTLFEVEDDPHYAAPPSAPNRALGRVRRWITVIRGPRAGQDPLGWDSCGCIHALRDTCDATPPRDSQYRAAFRHAFSKS